mgnify:CR=1 FL=1
MEGAGGEGAASAPSSIDFRPAQRQRGFWWWLFGTNDVGFVAAYRDLNGAVWRQSLAVPANQTTRLRVQAGTKTLNVGAGQ